MSKGCYFQCANLNEIIVYIQVHGKHLALLLSDHSAAEREQSIFILNITTRIQLNQEWAPRLLIVNSRVNSEVRQVNLHVSI